MQDVTSGALGNEDLLEEILMKLRRRGHVAPPSKKGWPNPRETRRARLVTLRVWSLQASSGREAFKLEARKIFGA